MEVFGRVETASGFTVAKEKVINTIYLEARVGKKFVFSNPVSFPYGSLPLLLVKLVSARICKDLFVLFLPIQFKIENKTS